MQVTVCDVGPRDGLQNEPDVLPAATRAELVSRLAATGLPRIEAVSFVRDDRVPQMADAEGVVEASQRNGAELSGLVLNEQGFARFEATGLDRLNCTLAATNTFNLRNGNATLEDAYARVQSILASNASARPTTVTISCAFGCPFEGEVDPGAVVDLCARLDADEVSLADTIGVATPGRVRALVDRVA
ncbi:MAG: hydroxymethylglutaryl-CoA lyase, partial [Actinobacteria bacterium]|nr:hydroxymethylglutaryl-CoA lyase [Actinomycetota bacterium]